MEKPSQKKAPQTLVFQGLAEHAFTNIDFYDFMKICVMNLTDTYKLYMHSCIFLILYGFELSQLTSVSWGSSSFQTLIIAFRIRNFQAYAY